MEVMVTHLALYYLILIIIMQQHFELISFMLGIKTQNSLIIGLQIENIGILSLFCKISGGVGTLMIIIWELFWWIIFKIFFFSTSINTQLLDSAQFNQLTYEQLQLLSASLSEKEIKNAACQFGQWKAPGPDGISVGVFFLFFIFFNIEKRNLVGKVITNKIRHISSYPTLISNLNFTDIVLFPKIFPIDFWPISLCNSIYKIFS